MANQYLSQTPIPFAARTPRPRRSIRAGGNSRLPNSTTKHKVDAWVRNSVRDTTFSEADQAPRGVSAPSPSCDLHLTTFYLFQRSKGNIAIANPGDGVREPNVVFTPTMWGEEGPSSVPDTRTPSLSPPDDRAPAKFMDLANGVDTLHVVFASTAGGEEELDPVADSLVDAHTAPLSLHSYRIPDKFMDLDEDVDEPRVILASEGELSSAADSLINNQTPSPSPDSGIPTKFADLDDGMDDLHVAFASEISSVADSPTNNRTPSPSPDSGIPAKFVDLDDHTDGSHVAFASEEEFTSVTDNLVDGHTPPPSPPGYQIHDKSADLDGVDEPRMAFAYEGELSSAADSLVNNLTPSPSPDSGIPTKFVDLDDGMDDLHVAFASEPSSVADSPINNRTPSPSPDGGPPAKFADLDDGMGQPQAAFASEQELSHAADSPVDRHTPPLSLPDDKAPAKFMDLDPDDDVDDLRVAFASEEELSSTTGSFIDIHTPSLSPPDHQIRDKFMGLDGDVTRGDVVLVPTRVGEELFASMVDSPVDDHIPSPGDGIEDTLIDLGGDVERPNETFMGFAEEPQSVETVRVLESYVRFPPQTSAKRASHVVTDTRITPAQEFIPPTLNGVSRAWGDLAYQVSHSYALNDPKDDTPPEALDNNVRKTQTHGCVLPWLTSTRGADHSPRFRPTSIYCT